MDAEQALADLMEISSQIEAAVIFDESGKVAGSTLADGARADDLARRADELLQRAASLRGGDAAPTQLEVATNEGSVFVVRDADVRIAATTSPQPTVGLVFYDLKSALRSVKPKPRPRAKPAAKKPAAAPKKPAAPRARKKPDAP
jgi:predicted regulator of Ras-like GTPase activity (Roadblock/LC7/MglB family)